MKEINEFEYFADEDIDEETNNFFKDNDIINPNKYLKNPNEIEKLKEQDNYFNEIVRYIGDFLRSYDKSLLDERIEKYQDFLNFKINEYVEYEKSFELMKYCDNITDLEHYLDLVTIGDEFLPPLGTKMIKRLSNNVINSQILNFSYMFFILDQMRRFRIIFEELEKTPDKNVKETMELLFDVLKVYPQEQNKE